MELAFSTKRKPEYVQTAVGQAKKPKTSDSSNRVQQDYGQCAKCGKLHNGACCAAGSRCYMYGQQGHMNRGCPKKGLICFHCNQTGLKRADCPKLQGGEGEVAMPVPTIMRITDGCPAKVEAPAVKSRAFQLGTEEARAAPDVVTGMQSIFHV
ncbi:uncharacterized protein LOC111903358 [Lactuca sativa]|uniref:uncharacterized protein LOC111903358 n=1 Tax=Lactuca sativa TaxID=4236 RepID=UPI0022AE5FB8|nr:uncharacterized protein LOC111903358 [Lactuca sativa]